MEDIATARLIRGTLSKGAEAISFAVPDAVGPPCPSISALDDTPCAFDLSLHTAGLCVGLRFALVACAGLFRIMALGNEEEVAPLPPATLCEGLEEADDDSASASPCNLVRIFG